MAAQIAAMTPSKKWSSSQTASKIATKLLLASVATTTVAASVDAVAVS